MRLLRLTGFALWLLASAASSWAQGGPDLAACFASEPELAALGTRCKAHGGCTLVLDRRTECTAARGFLQRLKEQMGDYPEIENNSVMSAATPPLRPVPELTSLVNKLHLKVQQSWRSTSNRHGGLRRTGSGAKAFYEGQEQDGIPWGLGTLISADGDMQRGNFVRGALVADGQIVLPGGAVRIGAMWEGQLKGEAAVQRPDGLVIVGWIEGDQPVNLVTISYPDGRSQKAYFDQPGKLSIAGPVAGRGEAPTDPDMSQIAKGAMLRMECWEERERKELTGSMVDPREVVRKLREMVRGPCGADPTTLDALAQAEGAARLAASRELEQARQQAAARAQADAERNAMVSNFLGQVSSILGSYQNMQQSAQASAVAAAAARPSAPAVVAATGNSGGGASSSASAPSSPPQSTGRTRPVHNPAADASSCVRMVQTSASTTTRISGNFTFHNGCNSTVEVFWCFPRPGGACTGGGTWTIGAGKGWPVMDNEAQIRWAACRGANGGGWDRDVPAGTRYTCPLLQW